MVTISFIGGGNWSTRRKQPTSASHWQTLSHNVVSSTPRLCGIRTRNFSGDSTDCIGSCKFNHTTITNTTTTYKLISKGHLKLEYIIGVDILMKSNFPEMNTKCYIPTTFSSFLGLRFSRAPFLISFAFSSFFFFSISTSFFVCSSFSNSLTSVRSLIFSSYSSSVPYLKEIIILRWVQIHFQ